jgi:hypothetical protein
MSDIAINKTSLTNIADETRILMKEMMNCRLGGPLVDIFAAD